MRTVRDPKLVDFGRHIIPKLVPEARVHAYVHRGYWEDVGTIQSYYRRQPRLCQPVPPFDFYDTARPVFSNPRFLPATKIEGSTIENALVAEGCIVQAEIRHALIGIRARIGRGVRVTGQPDPRERLLRDGRGGAARPPDQACPHRHRGTTRSSGTRSSTRTRASDAECGSPTRRARRGEGRAGVLHPGGNRHRSQERGHRGRNGDLAGPQLLAFADLLDLVVALGRDALAVASILEVDLLEGLGIGGLRALRTVR